MSQRIFQVLVPLCLLAILACGSPRIYPSDQQTRDRRHDCSSCRRERPEALASWYAPPGRREYPGLEPEVPHWPRNRPSQPDPSFSPSPHNFYGGAPRGREGPVIASPRGIAQPPDTYTREDSFNFQQRDHGFDVAAAPASPVRGLGAPSTLFQPRLPLTRSLRRTPYQSSSFYDVFKRESDPEANNRYTGFDPSGNEASMEDVYGSPRPYENPNKKVSVVYRGDKYADDSLDQGNLNAPAEEYFSRQAPEHYSRRQAPEPYPTTQAPAQYSRRQAPAQYFRRQAPEGKTPAGRQAEGVEGFQQPKREEYMDSHVVHAPEIKRDPYNWVPERNIMKIMQNVGKEGLTDTNGSAWQDQNGQELEGSPRKAAKTDGQKQAGDVNVLNDDNQSDEESGSQKMRDVVQEYGSVERSKKSTMLTPSTEISDREPENMWKTTEPKLEISTEPLTLP